MTASSASIVAGTWLTVGLVIAGHAAASPLDVRFNEIQVLGSHNSCHIQPEQRILDVLTLFDEALAISLECTHVPLPEQFSFQGVRQIELDVFADPLGGLYADRAAAIFFGEDPASCIPELDEPGMKVLHVQDIDFETTCLTLVQCLEIVKDWSDANPDHVPITVLIEAKDDPIPDPVELGFVIPVPIGPTELDTIDAEIRSVFAPEQLITPDDVRGMHATLRDAVLTQGWPTILDSRGKVLFALDNGGSVRDDYLAGHPSLTGRAMFASPGIGEPEAAFFKLNDPISDGALIADLVALGYIVRTRADADTLDARSGSTIRREAALASGAQFVSSDYPVPDPFGNNYFVEMPGGDPVRCNPISNPPDCLDAALERLDGVVEVAGRKLVMRDRDGDPAGRKIILRSKDTAIRTPVPGGGLEPTLTGATLLVSNPATGETARLVLPPGPQWKGNGDAAGARGYSYKDPGGADGPCTVVSVRPSRKLRVTCIGRNGLIPFSLDEASQRTIDVMLQLGNGDVYCTSFGGTIKRDRPASGGKPGAFIAQDAPPGGCPVP